MRAAKVISILLTAGLAAVACGSDEEKSPTGGTSGSGGTGTGGTLAGGTGGAPAGGTGGTGVGGDGSGGTAAAGGGNTGGSAGAIGDASGDTSTGGTGGGGVAAEVSCATGGDSGPATCSGGQACCVRVPGSDYCAALDGCECADGGQCLSVVPVACDGPEDCPSGEVCCGTLTTPDAGLMIPRYTSVGCQATCDTANDEYEFCHAGDGGSACRETGTICRTSTYMPPYEICAPSG